MTFVLNTSVHYLYCNLTTKFVNFAKSQALGNHFSTGGSRSKI